MEISLRLKAIADEVKGKTVADIATDHAYIPIYLCTKMGIGKAIASDINKKPLERAENNIMQYNCQNKIETRLGYGINEIGHKEVETVIIAGIGGSLLVDILGVDTNKTRSFNQLILQPQLDIHKVRKYLHKIGFKIVNENMIYEDGKFYTVINAEIGTDDIYMERDYLFGKILIKRKDEVLQKYLEIEMMKQQSIIYKLPNLKEVKQKYEFYKEVYMDVKGK